MEVSGSHLKTLSLRSRRKAKSKSLIKLRNLDIAPEYLEEKDFKKTPNSTPKKKSASFVLKNKPNISIMESYSTQAKDCPLIKEIDQFTYNNNADSVKIKFLRKQMPG